MNSIEVDRAPTRLTWMTGLRWPAALAVFILHVGVDWPSVRFIAQGLTGMSFFFMFSGFILTWSWTGAVGRKVFWARRFSRVWPLMAVSICVGMIVNPNTVTFWRIVLDFLALQGWSNDRDVYFSLNPPLVSMTAEVFFYLCFPLLILCVLKLTKKQIIPALVATIILIVMLQLSLNVTNPFDGTRVWLALYFPPTRMLEFLAGMLVARAVILGHKAPLSGQWAMILALLAVVFSATAPFAYRYVVITLVPFVLLFWGVADGEFRGTLRQCPKWLIWLGELSFVFYLFHRLALKSVWLALEHLSLPASWLLAAIVLFVLIALSSIIYKKIERPIERWLREKAEARWGNLP